MRTVAEASLYVNEDGQIVIRLTVDIDEERMGEKDIVLTRATSRKLADGVLKRQESAQ